MTTNKRTSPNFSQILTPYSPEKTASQIDVITKQMEEAIIESKKKSSVFENEISNTKPRRVVHDKLTQKIDTSKSTSQNHIISDHYLSGILETSLKDIKILSKSVDQKDKDLGFKKREAIDNFLKIIFSSKETDKLTKAKQLIENYLNKDEKTLNKACNFIASNASNNAVEGNASVNSGVSKKMDAPTDSKGMLLRSFDKIRDGLLEMGKVITKNPDQSINKALHETIMNAITPNIVGGLVRASSMPYKYNIGKESKYYEAPPSANGNYENNFHRGRSLDFDSTKKITDTQKNHIEKGFGFHRSKSLVTRPNNTLDLNTPSKIPSPISGKKVVSENLNKSI